MSTDHCHNLFLPKPILLSHTSYGVRKSKYVHWTFFSLFYVQSIFYHIRKAGSGKNYNIIWLQANRILSNTIELRTKRNSQLHCIHRHTHTHAHPDLHLAIIYMQLFICMENSLMRKNAHNFHASYERKEKSRQIKQNIKSCYEKNTYERSIFWFPFYIHFVSLRILPLKKDMCNNQNYNMILSNAKNDNDIE